jgi:hypothetical protein
MQTPSFGLLETAMGGADMGLFFLEIGALISIAASPNGKKPGAVDKQS